MLLKFSSLTKLLLLGFAVVAFLYACSKGGDSGGGTPPNPCAGVTISVTGTVTDADAASSNGSVAASASGGAASYTFSLNGGAFQGSGTFGSLAKGTYTITAKDSKGCTGSASFTVNEKNVCAGVTITLTATATNSDPCSASGVITATAGGSSGYTYSLNSGAFQASNVFNGVAVGNYTVNVKDAAGCTKSTTVSVTAVAAGPLFQAARSVIQTNCATAGCHTGGSAAGGISFSVDCNIVINKDRVKARAIDGNPSFMPPTGPLPQADRDKITAWINAGGRFTD
jgi:hypothetical protein